MPKALLTAGLPLAAAAFGDGRPTALDGDTLTVAVASRHAVALRDAEQLRLIAAVTGSALGRSITLRLSAIGGDGEEVLDERQRRYREAERHPLVQELLKRFEGDLTTREMVDFSTWLERLATERLAAQAPIRPQAPPAHTARSFEDAEVMDA